MDPDDPISADALRRLVLIRELYLRSVRMSDEPEPIAALSLLGFHDSVELFLHLAGAHLDAGLQPNTTFDQYWGPINDRLDGRRKLNGRVQMQKLNKARVGLKHYGNLPARIDIEGYKAAVATFFQVNSHLVFGLDFDAIDMLEVVTFERTRRHVERAATAVSEGHAADALGELALAFSWLMNEARMRSGLDGYAGWAIVTAVPVTDGGDTDLIDDVNSSLSDLADTVEREVQRLEEDLEMVALGIDLRRLQRFRLWTPWVIWERANSARYEWGGRTKRLQDDADHVEYCRRFVIDSALRLQGM